MAEEPDTVLLLTLENASGDVVATGTAITNPEVEMHGEFEFTNLADEILVLRISCDADGIYWIERTTDLTEGNADFGSLQLTMEADFNPAYVKRVLAARANERSR